MIISILELPEGQDIRVQQAREQESTHRKWSQCLLCGGGKWQCQAWRQKVFSKMSESVCIAGRGKLGDLSAARQVIQSLYPALASVPRSREPFIEALDG